jgi:hypothetical protein
MLRRPNAIRPTPPNHPNHSPHLHILFQGLMYCMLKSLISTLHLCPATTSNAIPEGKVPVSGDEGEPVSEVQRILPGHISGGIETSLAV